MIKPLRIISLIATCNFLPAQADDTALHQKVSTASYEVLIGGQLAGSGWFSDQPGHGFTALHVIGKSGRKIVIKQGTKRWNATLLAADARHDLALLKIAGKHPSGLSTQPGTPAIGATLFLYGTPIFRHHVWLSGKLASSELNYEYLGSEQLSIRCHYVAGFAAKGVSGGPWVNQQGRVVGLQSGTMTLGNSQQGLAFVTPAQAITDLTKTKRNFQTPSLECALEEILEQSPDWIAKLPKGQQGVLLKAIQKNGPLGKAGISNNTLLISINGKKLTTRNQGYAAIHTLKVNHPAALEIRLTDGTQKTIKVTPTILENAYTNPRKK